jgi:hypothetical protein
VTTSVPSSVVAAALGAGPGRPVEVLRVDDHPVYEGDGQGDGVSLVSGTAQVSDGPPRSFSVVRKRLRRTAGDRRAWDAVDREVDAYTSGLLDDLSGIEAPRLLGVAERPDGVVDLWLERVPGGPGTTAVWSLGRYRLAARHLGRFGAAGLAAGDAAGPVHPWLATDWLRRWVEAAGPEIRRLAAHADEPLVRTAYPPDVHAVVLDLWEHRLTWLGALDALPHGLAHQDAFRRNLADRAGHTVAFDWAFVGPAPVGAELAPLLMATVAFGEWPVERWRELDRAVREGYLAGLREGGWSGDDDLVTLGHTASAVLRYPVGTARLMMPYVMGESDPAVLERVLRVPFSEAIRRWGEVGRIGVELHAEAARLLGAGPG